MNNYLARLNALQTMARDLTDPSDVTVSPEIAKHLARLIIEQIRDKVWITTVSQLILLPLHTLIDAFGFNQALFRIANYGSNNVESTARHIASDGLIVLHPMKDLQRARLD